MNIFYKKKKHLILLALLLVCYIYFYTLNKQSQEGGLSQVLYFVTAEIQTASVNLKSGISSTIKKYAFLLDLQDENRHLKIENTKLQTQQNLLTETLNENERLKSLLEFTKTSDFSILPAKVISKDFLYQNHLISINKGSSHGVKKSMGVIHPNGVVGYVFRTSLHSSQVITILNKLSSLPAIHQASRINGLVEPYKSNTLVFKHFSLGDSIIKEKDLIVSAKTDQIPSGTPIGFIKTVENEKEDIEPTITIEPYVHFSSLEEVLVIVNPQKLQHEK